MEFRRWFRTRTARELTLGDVRTLLTRADELGLPADQYVVRANCVPWSGGQRVRSISAQPKD